MVHLGNSETDEIECENEIDINNQKEERSLQEQSFLGVREAFLGYCPMCEGEVYGAVDAAKCAECGWTNRRAKYGCG